MDQRTVFKKECLTDSVQSLAWLDSRSHMLHSHIHCLAAGKKSSRWISACVHTSVCAQLAVIGVTFYASALIPMQERDENQLPHEPRRPYLL